MKKNLSSKIFETFCGLNLAKFFLAGVEEHLAVICFLLLLGGAIGDWEKPTEARGAQEPLGAD